VYNIKLDPALTYFYRRTKLNIYVNVKRIGTNRQTIPVEPLHGIKFGVWCAVSATIAFGPFFFLDKINSERYSMQHIISYFSFENVSNDRKNF
jgi:hypothetical protein